MPGAGWRVSELQIPSAAAEIACVTGWARVVTACCIATLSTSRSIGGVSVSRSSAAVGVRR